VTARGNIHDAAYEGDVATVQRLLDGNPALVNARAQERNFAPLHLAVMADRAAVAQLLLARGAEVEARDELGWTPLHHAVSVAVQELLVANGANVGARDNGGRTPLHVAALSGRADLAQFLLARGADVNARDSEDGVTPLHMAAFNGQRPVAELLLVSKADINARDREGQTPLTLALKRGQTAIADFLRQRGAME
jgi:cytohesin